MNLFSLSKRRGATLAGIFSVALSSVLLLCGAGSVPIENLLPQGAMQGDLNAGGHNLTNAATVSATNVIVSGTLTAPSLATVATSGAYGDLTGTPTLGSLAGLSPTGTADSSHYLRGDDTWAAAPVTAVAGRTGAVTLSPTDISGLAASATTDTTSAGNITSGTLAIGRIPLGTTSSTVAVGNDTRFPASVTGLRNGAGAGSSDTAATANQIAAAAAGATSSVNGASQMVQTDASNNLPVGVPATASHAPSGTVVIIIGDSIAAGYPVVTLDGSNHQSGYTGPGYAGAQWLSAQPYFKGIPIYTFGIGAAQASTTELTSTSNHGTEYVNGAAVGSIGSISVAASSLVSSTGPTWFINQFGANDVVGSSLSTYLSNMGTLYSTEHGYGASVFCCGVTITARSAGTNKEALWNLSIRAQSATPASAAGWDVLADVGTLFDDNATSSTDGLYNTDGLHFLSPGYLLMYDVIGRAISSNHSVLPSSAVTSTVFSNGKVYDASQNASIDIVNHQLLNGTLVGMDWGGGCTLRDELGSEQLNATSFGVKIMKGANDSSGTLLIGSGTSHGSLGNYITIAESGSGGDLKLTSSVTGGGSIQIENVGAGLKIKEGTNAKQGVATLAAGTVTVSDTAVTSSSRIFLTTQSLGTVTVPKEVAVTGRTAGTSFTITSADATDTSVVAWEIIEPAP